MTFFSGYWKQKIHTGLSLDVEDFRKGFSVKYEQKEDALMENENGMFVKT